MDGSEIQSALDHFFDDALVYHGYADFYRDYDLFVSISSDPRTGIPPQEMRYRFKYCVEASVRTTLDASIWRASLDERLVGREMRSDLKGHVWGVRWQVLYPGGRVIEGSDRARAWATAIGIDFHEVEIETNAHLINLVASDLDVTQVDPGFAPFVVSGPEA